MRLKIRTTGKRKVNEDQGYQRVSEEKSTKRRLLKRRLPGETEKNIDPFCKNHGKPSNNAAGQDIENSFKGRVEGSNASGSVEGSYAAGSVEGSNAAGSVEGSYAAGSVEGSNAPGSGEVQSSKSSKSSKMLHLTSSLVDKKTTIKVKSGKHIRQDNFIEAYVNCRFSITKAAKATGVSKRVFFLWKDEPDFILRFNDAVETKKDFVEDALLKKVAKGDIAAIIFASKCLLKDRGYIEKSSLRVSVKDNHLNLTKEQKDLLIEAAMVSPETIPESPVKKQLLEIIKQKST